MYLKVNFYILISLLFSGYLQTNDIVITIDDLPLGNGQLFTVEERAQRFIEACKQENYQLVFFAVGEHYLRNNSANKIFQMLVDNDHFIANHSMTHPLLSKISLEDFQKEVTTTEALFEKYGLYRKWFRYPGLDQGNITRSGGSTEKRKTAYWILRKLGYTEAYVTIHTLDWYINKRLTEALKNGLQIDYVKLRTLYLSLINEWTDYFSAHYNRLFPNEPLVHSLLLHDNDLNALYLKDIIALFRYKGWNIVSPEKAFNNTHLTYELLTQKKIAPTPTSLNRDTIDALLEEYNIFTS